MGLITEKMETLYAELNKRAKAATNCYSATGDFLQYIYSVCACDYESSEHPIEVFMNRSVYESRCS